MAYTAGTNSTNRSIAIGVVVVMHLLLGWAFASGLARTAVEMIAGPVEVKIIKETVKKEELPPPPPPKQIDMPKIELPPAIVPEITLDAPPPPAQTTINVQAKPTEAKPAPKVATVPFQIRKGASRGLAKAMADIYPAASIRLEEEGAVKVYFCLGTDGRVNKDETKLVQSSGFSRLDEAVMKQALSGGFDRFFSVGKDEAGAPVAGCANVPFRFTLDR